MVADRIEGYASALFEVASVEGTLGDIEDELFRFARTLEGSDELRDALTDASLPASRRQQIVEDLLGPRAQPLTTALVSFVVGAGRGRDLPAIIDRLVARAATSRHHEVAEVRSVVELSEDQRTRLAAALSNATGKQVEVKVIIDPTILGGLVAQVGDTVIDGSVRHRLNQLRERL
ncbi:MAG TPA: ATP synthase F1 subunit delta [Acidimicrobiales bacterium]|jgi:F-type H+-transporting ATPase subunit delta